MAVPTEPPLKRKKPASLRGSVGCLILCLYLIALPFYFGIAGYSGFLVGQVTGGTIGGGIGSFVGLILVLLALVGISTVWSRKQSA